MNHLVSLGKWLGTWLGTFGGPGLFAVAFIDSSFLSLPEINDILIISFVMQHPERLLYYALMSTLGSIAGCFVVYFVGLKGGEAVLKKSFSAGRIDRAMAAFQRYGFLALLVPAILPPPAPFKIFVLLAGVARVRMSTFALAIGIGRGLRYLVEGILAVRYGDLALEYMRHNAKTAALVVAGVVLVLGIAYILWSRRDGAARQTTGQ